MPPIVTGPLNMQRIGEFMKILSLLISLFLLSEVNAQKDFTVGMSFPEIKLPSLSDGKLTSLADNERTITDKMLLNRLNVALIFIMFPGAKVVHCKRDPLDLCLSYYQKDFGDSHYYSYDLHDLGVYFNDYQKLMGHWEELFPGKIFDVQYDFVIINNIKKSIYEKMGRSNTDDFIKNKIDYIDLREYMNE